MGTGSGTGRVAIQRLVEVAAGLRAGYPGEQRPPIYFAALKKRMLHAAYLNAEGAILNFCPPSYVQRILPHDAGAKGFTLACYIKLFFAENDADAKRMLISELRMYDSIPQYHAMFEEIGASDSISKLDPDRVIPDDLLEISLANPGDDEAVHMLELFTHSGVDLPIIYPYISGDEAYRTSVVERLASVA